MYFWYHLKIETSYCEYQYLKRSNPFFAIKISFYTLSKFVTGKRIFSVYLFIDQLYACTRPKCMKYITFVCLNLKVNDRVVRAGFEPSTSRRTFQHH